MEEDPKRIAIVIDANVLISSLIKPSGTTARILYRLIDLNTPLYVPAILWKEIEAHKDHILRKNLQLVGIFDEVLRRAKLQHRETKKPKHPCPRTKGTRDPSQLNPP